MANNDNNEVKNCGVAQNVGATLHSEQVKDSVVRREIRLDLIFKSIMRNRRKFIVPMISTIVVTAIIIFSVPRYYRVSVMLAPESSNNSSGLGGISSLASMAGINLSNLSSDDAIVPLFYPDLMASTGFIVPLFDTQVQTLDGNFKGSYVDYLTKQAKSPWWDQGISAIGKALGQKKPVALKKAKNGKLVIDPFRLNKVQDDLVKAASGNIACRVDKKTDVITITVEAQDPLVAALMADTVKEHLQLFITNYRTKKAKNDLQHYQELLAKAHKDYEAKQKEYASYADANQDVVLTSYKTKEESLENELQLAYNSYSQLKMQVQLAEAKVMERTPAFTTLQNASVPIRPAGPKRVKTILAMMIVCFICTSIYIVSKDDTLRY